jgi:hypothetical protein
VSTLGGGAFRVPWIVTPAKREAPLIGDVQISATSFKPSDTAPAVVSLLAGRVSGGQLRPLRLLDLELWRDGAEVGRLVRVRDLLPGRYAFGLTGRDAEGDELEPGRYTLMLRALPTDGGKAETRSLAFRIR